MHSYSAHGLSICSEIRLAGCAAGSGKADLQIRYASEHPPLPDSSAAYSFARIGARTATLAPLGGGVFTIRHGREIDVCPRGSEEAALSNFATGAALAVALHQRGLLVLHASAVEIDGRVILFLGESGSGKSSLASGLSRRGCAFVSDDLCAVELSGAAPAVFTGGPRTKLYAGIAMHLGWQEAHLQPIEDGEEKMAAESPVMPSHSVHSLSAIYFLSRQPQSEPIENVKPAAAVIELLGNSLPYRLTHIADGEVFLRCTELARRIPAFRLQTFGSLAELIPLIDRIERHARIAVKAAR